MIKRIVISLTIFLISYSAHAADLVEVYCHALKCDPTFKEAYANLLSNREEIPINRAALLPRVDFHGEVYRQRIEAEGLQQTSRFFNVVFVPTGKTTFYNTSVFYTLTAKQPLFNFSDWAKLQTAKAFVKSSEATFCAQAQDLIIRVARTYFDVMKSEANVHFLSAQERAVLRQLEDSRERFRVGVLAKTGVLEAQAKYDQIVAQEVTAQYDLAIKIEQLHAITNCHYQALQGVCNGIPLVTPDPGNILEWVCLAERQNYSLEAARYTALGARENIKTEFGAHLPEIDAIARYTYDYDSNPTGSGILLRIKQAEIGLSMNWAIFHGGEIDARTRQAIHDYVAACAEQEFTHRDVLLKTRNAYLGVFSGINQIRADNQQIISGREALRATVESYKAGIRTILDVFNVQSNLYEAYKNYVQHQYDYLLQTLLLKQAAGVLCVTDLQFINCMLQMHIDFSCYTALLNGCLLPSCPLPIPRHSSGCWNPGKI